MLRRRVNLTTRVALRSNGADPTSGFNKLKNWDSKNNTSEVQLEFLTICHVISPKPIQILIKIQQTDKSSQ